MQVLQTECVTWGEVHHRVTEQCKKKYPAANPKGLHSVAAHGIIMFMPLRDGIIHEDIKTQEVFGDPVSSDYTINNIIAYVEKNLLGHVIPEIGMKRLENGEMAALLRGDLKAAE